jgi:hypothetical protein
MGTGISGTIRRPTAARRTTGGAYSALRDNPINPDYQDGQIDFHRLKPVFSTDQPEVHDIVAKMRAVVGQRDRDAATE